ncbi:YnfU family zinc-binding protein [Yersinia kristensenii]|uniref:YnfU family zinc-binding protein n=1 Tax=Yersinia kristensenii TaxID=28152 RepID=UPI001C969B17|nr:YnfU family zinc-binding protein [Yersinia kristensenii]
MSFLDSIRKLVSSAKVSIKCPDCGATSEQSTEKVHKNTALVCPKCGCLFLPKDKK